MKKDKAAIFNNPDMMILEVTLKVRTKKVDKVVENMESIGFRLKDSYISLERGFTGLEFTR